MPKTAAHYLVKSEPSVYSFAQLCRDGRTSWEGVRNYEARNNLRRMRVGDLLLYYHSNEGKQIVGVARVVKAAYPDATAPGEDWSTVDVAPVVALTRPVTLAEIKAEPRLAELALLRKSRISVVPVTATEFALLLRLGGTKLPGPELAKAPAKTSAKAKPETKPRTKAPAQTDKKQRQTAAAPPSTRPTPTAKSKASAIAP